MPMEDAGENDDQPTCWWTSLRANTTHSTNSRMTYFSLQPFVWLSCFMHLFFVFTYRKKTDDWIVYDCVWTIGHRTQLYALWLIALAALISSKFHGSDWFKCTLNIIGTRFWLWAALIWNWVLYFEWRCKIARFQLSQLAVSDISHHGNRPNGHENMQCDEIILCFFFRFVLFDSLVAFYVYKPKMCWFIAKLFPYVKYCHCQCLFDAQLCMVESWLSFSLIPDNIFKLLHVYSGITWIFNSNLINWPLVFLSRW